MSNEIVYQPQNRDIWFLLGFQAGYLNVGALLALQTLMVHVTGTFTLLGHQFAQGNWMLSLTFLLLLFFFWLGAFSSTLATEIRRKSGRPALYPQMILVLGGILLSIVVLSEFKYFGEFGEKVALFHHYVLIAFLAFCSGLQNAVITQYTKAVVRTTHLTGPITDLGIGAAKVIIHGDELEYKKNLIRIETILAFVAGSFLATFAFTAFHFRAFLVTAVLSFIVSLRLFALPRET